MLHPLDPWKTIGFLEINHWTSSLKQVEDCCQNLTFSVSLVGPQWGGGGGGTQIVSVYVGSDPASTIHPQKISGISCTPLKKVLKRHRNDPQTSPIL